MKGGFDTSPGMIEKIISGGQTGADRAALDWAIASGVPHGGWCPKGRKAEDGPIPSCYTLTESPSANYLQRTEWNARDADGTAVLFFLRKKRGISPLQFGLVKMAFLTGLGNTLIQMGGRR